MVNSQVELFTEYGGVIPEIAARDHSVKIINILKTLLKKADKNLHDINLEHPLLLWCQKFFESGRLETFSLFDQ